LCTGSPLDPGLTAFGYGLDRGRLPRQLLEGGFDVSVHPLAGQWEARGDGLQMVDSGDSGGPAVTSDVDADLGKSVPSLCFVISAVQARDPSNAVDRRPRALLEPTWKVGSTL
jgi:hypothetical protein